MSDDIKHKFEEEHKKLFAHQMSLEEHYKRIQRPLTENEAATKIQALYRGSSVRKSMTHELEQKEKGWDSSKKLVTPLGGDTMKRSTSITKKPQDENEAATKIQATYRGNLVRKNTKGQLSKKSESGTTFPSSVLSALPPVFGATDAEKDTKLKILLVALVVLIVAIMFMGGGGAKKIIKAAATAVKKKKK